MEKLVNKKKLVVLFIFVSTLIITYFHHVTLSQVHDLHNILTELYYLPLLLGALAFGLKGAVYSLIFITTLYAPYMIINWSGTHLFITNKLLHALFSGSLAIMAGILIDRAKNHRQQLEKERYLASLGQASAAIVHDLKSPLITVEGFAKRINEERGDIKEESQIILDSAEKMQMIVNDVLDFAKPINLDFHQEDLLIIICNACQSCKSEADEKEVTLSTNLPANPVMVAIDSFKLERAFVNLLNNAIEASLIGDTVSIVAEQNEIIVITIRDNGEGMDKETLDNIFIPFYTKKSTGTGLGMAFYFCHAAHVAEVAEVTVDKNRNFQVKKVTVAVDVGPIINMSGARSQVQGSIVDGLSTMALQQITINNGVIEQGNFDDYSVMRIAATPEMAAACNAEYAACIKGDANMSMKDNASNWASCNSALAACYKG
jgi:two-component system sensor histidine kinase HydH